jgi:hypothetical protein
LTAGCPFAKTQPPPEVRNEVNFSRPGLFETALITWGKIKSLDADATTLGITDGGSTVRVAIDSQGRSLRIKQETINKDVDAKRKPVRLGIALDDKNRAASFSLRIDPGAKWQPASESRWQPYGPIKMR